MTNNKKFTRIQSDKKVLLIGSAVVDVVVNIPALPSTGGDTFASNEERIVGGCAYNIGNILQQLSASFDYFMPIGTGPQADKVTAQLQADGQTSLLNNLPGDNGWCLCMVEPSGERTFLTVPGIENNWQASWFEQIDLTTYDYIYLSGYAFEAEFSADILAGLQKKHPNTKIIFDPSPRVGEMNPDDLKKLWTLTTIVHCNKEELLTLTKMDNIEAGAEVLHELTQCPVIVTLGKHGTFILEDGNHTYVTGEKVTVVDTIGAGDSHVAGTIAGLLADKSVIEACQWGNEIAAEVVQIKGGKWQFHQ